MADYATATRIIAISSLLVALEYPAEIWEEAYDRIKNYKQPDTLDDVAAIVTALTAAKPEILGALLAEQDGDLLVPEVVTHEPAPKTTRTRGNG